MKSSTPEMGIKAFFRLRPKMDNYGYLSGYFKARENLFLKSSDLDVMRQAQNKQDFLAFLSSKRYQLAVSHADDPKDFEDALWKAYFDELKTAQKYMDDSYLTDYLSFFHSLVFTQEELSTMDLTEELFEQHLQDWKEFSSKGTVFTKKLAQYVIDRFNINEVFRSKIHHQEIFPFYEGGQLSHEDLDELFNSNFQHIPQKILFSIWHSFFEHEKPLKKIDFNLILRFEYYWFDLISKLLEEPLREPYGINYLLAWFLYFMLEIQTINRNFLRLSYDLPSYWMKEVR
jgi:vacuolar-type H+-ATPase subunit C/Vma6